MTQKAYLSQGVAKTRDNDRDNLVTHLGVTADNTAFSAAHTRINPDETKAVLVKAATKTAVGADSFDTTIQIDGDTEFTDETIWALGQCDGPNATDAISRSVRTQGIGVQAGDSFTIGLRQRNEDGGE